jgi:hypothetical protein
VEHSLGQLGPVWSHCMVPGQSPPLLGPGKIADCLLSLTRFTDIQGSWPEDRHCRIALSSKTLFIQFGLCLCSVYLSLFWPSLVHLPVMCLFCSVPSSLGYWLFLFSC